MTIQETSIVLILAPIVAPLLLFAANMGLIVETKYFKAANVSIPAYIVALITGVAGTVAVIDFFVGSLVAWAGVLAPILLISLAVSVVGFIVSGLVFDSLNKALDLDNAAREEE